MSMHTIQGETDICDYPVNRMVTVGARNERPLKRRDALVSLKRCAGGSARIFGNTDWPG